MAQDRRYARLQHKHIAADVTDLDSIYLRLDTSNDPLTGQLRTRSISPESNMIHDIGSADLRFDEANFGTIYCRNVVTDADYTIDPTVTYARSTNIIAENGGAYTAGTRTLRINGAPSSVTDGSPNVTIFTDGGAIKQNRNVDADFSGGGSFHMVNIHSGITGSGASSIIKNNMFGSMLCGTVSPGSSGTLTLQNTTPSNNFMAGNLTGGMVTNIFDPGTPATIENNWDGFFEGGSFVWGFASAGLIRNESAGCFISGYASGSGLLNIDTGSRGSFASGFAQNTGIIQVASGNNGCFVQGYAKAAGSSIIADNIGAMASGYALTNGHILASGLGSFARGYTLGGAISATATNAVQFGEGVNAEAETVSAGTMVRIKGTVGAPGTPRNGDIWVDASGIVNAESEGNPVQLSDTTNTWTTGGHATLRNTNTATTLAQAHQLIETLIEDLVNRGFLT